MKKLLFTLLSLGTFLVHANAAGQCYVQTSGSIPPAYCWDISYVGSTLYGYYEPTVSKSSTVEDHGGDIYAKIDAYGYNSHTEADVKYQNMYLLKTQNIVNSYNIVVGTRHWYRKLANTADSGTIRATQYSIEKDSVYFR